MVGDFYETKSVGTLSNNSERKFGLSALLGKFIWKAPEIKADMALDQAELQSLISGEEVTINRKNKVAKTIIWKAPGIFAGNEAPNWRDNSASIQRRMVIFDFHKPVRAEDCVGNLQDLLREELPEILVKCNRAYRVTAQAHGQKNIWSLLPTYFKTTSKDLLANIHPLEAFLESEYVDMDPESYVLLSRFKDELQGYCHAMGMGRQRISKDFLHAPLLRRNLKVERDETLGHDIIRGIRLTVDFVGAPVDQL